MPMEISFFSVSRIFLLTDASAPCRWGHGMWWGLGKDAARTCRLCVVMLARTRGGSGADSACAPWLHIDTPFVSAETPSLDCSSVPPPRCNNPCYCVLNVRCAPPLGCHCTSCRGSNTGARYWGTQCRVQTRSRK